MISVRRADAALDASKIPAEGSTNITIAAYKRQTFTLTSFEDGINADRQAMHYTKSSQQVRKGDTIKVRMVRNGGYAATIE